MQMRTRANAAKAALLSMCRHTTHSLVPASLADFELRTSLATAFACCADVVADCTACGGKQRLIPGVPEQSLFNGMPSEVRHRCMP